MGEIHGHSRQAVAAMVSGMLSMGVSYTASKAGRVLVPYIVDFVAIVRIGGSGHAENPS